jgi:hypothetical protein
MSPSFSFYRPAAVKKAYSGTLYFTLNFITFDHKRQGNFVDNPLQKCLFSILFRRMKTALLPPDPCGLSSAEGGVAASALLTVLIISAENTERLIKTPNPALYLSCAHF